MRCKKNLKLLLGARVSTRLLTGILALIFPFRPVISINGKACRVSSPSIRYYLGSYLEIIIYDCYRIFDYAARKNNPSVIVDIGAHLGIFSVVCSLLFPQAEIFAYEPNPVSFKWLLENCKRRSIHALPYAVTFKGGRQKLLVPDGDSGAGYISDKGDCQINSIMSSEVAGGREIDFLKMDCEGSEWDIFNEPSLLKRTKLLAMEYHIPGTHSFSALKSLIHQGGHSIIGTTPLVGGIGFLYSQNSELCPDRSSSQEIA